jgi:diguanylate cyclase
VQGAALDTVSARQLKQTLQVVEKALRHYTHWHNDLIRRLLCRLPMPESMVAKDAHRHCAFGIWFYGIGTSCVEKVPAFKTIGELHKAMHDSAREVCQKIRATGFVSEVDYDSFLHHLTALRSELNDFKTRLEHTLADSQAHEAVSPSALVGQNGDAA